MHSISKLHVILEREDLLTAKEIEQVVQAFSLLKLKKGESFIERESKQVLIGFITNGALKAVEQCSYGKTLIHYFLFENDFFSESNLLYEKLPAKLCIQAIGDCEILHITMDELKVLFSTIPNLKELFHLFNQDALVSIQKAYQLVKTKDAKDRYLQFKQLHQKQSKEIPAKDVAAFLGITPFTLSRIKKNLLKNSEL